MYCCNLEPDRRLILAFLLSLPLLSVSGATIFRTTGSNIILLALFALICFVPILMHIDALSPRYYSFALWAVSLSLLYQSTLSTPQLTWDLTNEVHYSRMVFHTGYWDPSLLGNTNSVLSIVLVQPILAIVGGTNLTWAIKLGYPLVYATLPVLAYHIYKHKSSDKHAFLAAFFVLSYYAYFVYLTNQTRTGLAEVAMLGTLLLLYYYRTSKPFRGLAILLAFSVVFSHYGVAFMFAYAIVGGAIITHLLSRFTVLDRAYPYGLIFLILVLTASYYSFAASGFGIRLIVPFVIDTLTKLLTVSPFSTLEAGGSVSYAARDWPLSIEVAKYLLYASVGLGGIGILAEVRHLLRHNHLRADVFTSTMAIMMFLLLALSAYFRQMNVARVGHLAFLFAAPLIVRGWIALATFLTHAIDSVSVSQIKYSPHEIASALMIGQLILLLVFTGGVASEAIGGTDYAPNALISEERIETMPADTANGASAKENLQQMTTSTSEHIGARWLHRFGASDADIDSLGHGYPLHYYFGHLRATSLISSNESSGTYVFLRSLAVDGVVLTGNSSNPSKPTDEKLGEMGFNHSPKVYANGGSEIYWNTTDEEIR